MVTKTYDLSRPAFEFCSRFHKCNVNRCWLDTNKKCVSLPEDKETRCTIAKSIRVRIGTAYKLPNKGMKPREISSQQNWDNLPEAEKKRRIDRIKQSSPLARCLKAGLKVSPKAKSKISNPQVKGISVSNSPIRKETNDFDSEILEIKK
jgi:hypothetical protein